MLTNGRFEDGGLTVELRGHVDTGNAAQVEAEIRALRQHPEGALVLDQQELS